MILTYAQVADKLVHATDKKQLTDASQLIQHVVDIDHRDKLAVIYKTRTEEFKATGNFNN